MYTPLTLSGALADGATTATESATELGRNVFATYQQLRPGATHHLSLFVDGEEPLTDNGWYELAVPHQAGVDATPTHIQLTLPAGWKFAAGGGHAAQRRRAPRDVRPSGRACDLTAPGTDHPGLRLRALGSAPGREQRVTARVSIRCRCSSPR